jgi:hypothetical protein
MPPASTGIAGFSARAVATLDLEGHRVPSAGVLRRPLEPRGSVQGLCLCWGRLFSGADTAEEFVGGMPLDDGAPGDHGNGVGSAGQDQEGQPGPRAGREAEQL